MFVQPRLGFRLVLTTAVVCGVVGPFDAAMLNGGEPAESRVRIADEEIPDILNRWNLAVERVTDNRLNAALALVCAEERSGWLESDISVSLFRASLPVKVTRESAKVAAYLDGEGRGLAHIYLERRRTVAGRAKGIPLHDRIRLGTLVRTGEGPWMISLARDRHEFGLGASVAGVRLNVEPAEQNVNSWRNVKLRLSLQNVQKQKMVQLYGHPSFLLEWNLGIVLRRADPPEAAQAFQEWYIRLAATSPPTVSGLIESIDSAHRSRSVPPGQKASHEVPLAGLCWAGGEKVLAEGPEGTFELSMIYDANLEWDPVEASLPVWRHRVASSPFRVTVKRAP